MFVVLLLLSLVIVDATRYGFCAPPNVELPIFPKQYMYNHGESISVGYPHQYFLRCMKGKWV